ncbi:MAG: MFS transporter [Rhizomicrobium sp.]
MADAATRDDITSLRTKIFYGLGSIAFGVKDNGFQTILLPFYNQVMHLPPQLVGAALAIAMIFDAIFDPIVGNFSDHLRTRWGRRHPLMYASALPVAISYLLLWNPPHWSQGALFAYLVIVAVVTRTFITFYEIPSSALVPELTADYDQRTSFMSLSHLLRLVWRHDDASAGLFGIPTTGCDAQGRAAQRSGLQPLRYRCSHRDVLRDPDFGLGHTPLHPAIPAYRPLNERTIGQYVREMFATLSNRRVSDSHAVGHFSSIWRWAFFSR